MFRKDNGFPKKKKNQKGELSLKKKKETKKMD